jgi:uncharacterized protein YndB with AHSA1/START domain
MPHIHHELLIGASVERVYNAITSNEGLSGWWTPGTKAEAVIGSIARFEFGPHYFKEMKVMELKPPGRVEWTCAAGAAEWIGTAISFELKSLDKERLLDLHPELEGQAQQQDGNAWTLLMFRHDNWSAYTPMFAECNYTWARFLWSLKSFCETGKGSSWPDQHRGI